ncbi:MAG TPA: tetratricopeptide repeat protein [Anaerolineales bacterium]|nr:tetratricopeptide repeat protein [Anaerolineales bacterium]
MTRRRKRPNLFSWTVLGLVVLFGYYVNQVYLPSQPNPFDPTPTATRSPESYASEAAELFKNGKLLQSIESYEAAINASPQDPSLYIALARIQVWAGQYEEAQANAENALLLNPENSTAHAVRAWALDFQGQNSTAMEAIQKAVEIDDRNALAHAYYTEILVDSGLFDNFDNAAEHSKIALTLDPNLLEARRARGYLLATLGNEGNNFELAIQQYRDAIELNPYIPVLHMELGQALRSVGVFEEAVTEFTLANTLNPPDPEPDLLISRTYATMGEFAKALQYAEEAMKNRPTDPSLHANYGVMLYRNFFYEEAAKELGLAINGGLSEEGFPIKPLTLSNDVRVAEYYFTYGLALARTNQCGQSLQLGQEIQSRVRLDEFSMEVVNDAVNRAIEICQENLENPTEEPIATEEAVEPTTVVKTETPDVTPTATP